MGVFGAIGNAIKKPMQAAGKVVGKAPGMSAMGKAVAPGMGMLNKGMGLGPSAPPQLNQPMSQPMSNPWQTMVQSAGQLGANLGGNPSPAPMNNGIPPVQGGVSPGTGQQDDTTMAALRGPGQLGQGPQQGIGPSFGQGGPMRRPMPMGRARQQY